LAAIKKGRPAAARLYSIKADLNEAQSLALAAISGKT
jgi:hypothetical protein